MSDLYIASLLRTTQASDLGQNFLNANKLWSNMIQRELKATKQPAQLGYFLSTIPWKNINKVQP